MTAADPLDTLRRHRVVVCVGTGGVGKTTIAAALALEAARRGPRALVLTIDPARRLAGALGLESLGGEPDELPPRARAALGIEGDGRLFAMMLDMKSTFDGLVDRFAENEDARSRILANAIYAHVSDALAGSAEYAAMEKVYELLESERFDLIVLDTPPAQNAIDFLDAPRRLLEFIDSRVVRLLIHPAFVAGRAGFRLFQRPGLRVLEMLERLLGMGFLRDLSEFLLAFEAMADGFRLRATRVREMLLGPRAAFVLVAGPSYQAARNAEAFLQHLAGQRVPLAGVVVNRVRLWQDGHEPTPHGDGTTAVDVEAGAAAIEAAIRATHPDADAAALAEAACGAATQYDDLVALDRRNSAALRQRGEALGLFVRAVPELPEDVHDVEGLRAVGRALFADADTDATAASGPTATGGAS